MLFSELYSAYYNAVAAVLTSAVHHPLERKDIKRIVEENAFGESIVTIPDAFASEKWPLLLKDGTTTLHHAPTMPLTTLQKRWLCAIAKDPRIRLFGDVKFDFPDVEPLFLPEDVCVFDKYADGDPYEDEDYIRTFRLILWAIENGRSLHIDSKNRFGESKRKVLTPERLEYSEKDDKFRVIGKGRYFGHTINLSRITHCGIYDKPEKTSLEKEPESRPKSVTFEVVDERNALERVLLHFAHFKKQAERIDEKRYRITIDYVNEDETEMVIRILSFGPMVKVTSQSHFVELIKQRLKDQKSCEH